jgi:hypothetical protein
MSLPFETTSEENPKGGKEEGSKQNQAREILKRRGISPESAARLRRKAMEAAIFFTCSHGHASVRGNAW